MGKKQNKSNKATIIPPTPEVKAEEKVKNDSHQEKIEVIDANGLREQLGDPNYKGLSPDRRVDLLKMMHETYRMDPEASKRYGISQETVDKINNLTAHAQVVVLACEVEFGKNPFALMMRKSQIDQMNLIGQDMGITFDPKLLPAPNVEGIVEVPSTAIKVSEETKKRLKKEHEAATVDIPDPTKIENESKLVEAINSVMANCNNGWEKLKTSIDFYRSYLNFQANKSENKDEELKKIKEKTNLVLLEEIKNLIKNCPLVLSGMGRSMGTFTGSSKSPIPAFCIMRNSTKNRKTGETAINDDEIADYARFIVMWVNEISQNTYEKRIKDYEENLKVLNKDKKANEKAIADTKEKIESCKSSIEHLAEVTEIMTNPSSEPVDNLIDLYNEKDKIARTVFNHVVTSYYNDVDTNSVNIQSFKHNVQQRAGIILNLFRNPTTPITEYNVANLVDMSAEEPKKE